LAEPVVQPGQPLSFSGEEEMKCKHCGEAIHKTPIGWTHDYESGVYCPSKTKAEPLSKRIVPLVNPLRIPIGWWGIAMDASGRWYVYQNKPKIVRGFSGHMRGDAYFEVDASVNFAGDWEESMFTRAEIQERWEQEYGSDWYDNAMKDAI